MNIDERKQLAAGIRRRRLALGWTQDELAERAGVSLGTVGNAENATTVPQPGRLEMMLAALEEGESRIADRPGLLTDANRAEMAEWLHSTIAVHSASDRAAVAGQLADVYDTLRPTLKICWTLLQLNVDIEVVQRLVDETTEAFIASGAYVGLATAGIDKADEFLSESGSLVAEIKRRREAGELGQPSFISKMTERARREGYRAGVEAAVRRRIAEGRAEEFVDDVAAHDSPFTIEEEQEAPDFP